MAEKLANVSFDLITEILSVKLYVLRRYSGLKNFCKVQKVKNGIRECIEKELNNDRHKPEKYGKVII